MSEPAFREDSPGAIRLARLAQRIMNDHRPTRVEVLRPVIDTNGRRRLRPGDLVDLPHNAAVTLAEDQAVRILP